MSQGDKVRPARGQATVLLCQLTSWDSGISLCNYTQDVHLFKQCFSLAHVVMVQL